MIKSQISGHILFGFAFLILVFSCKTQEEVDIIPSNPDITSVNVSSDETSSDAKPDTPILETDRDSLVSGTLIDVSGDPIIAAKVELVDSDEIAFSDIIGKWELDAKGHSYEAILISLDGYKSKKMSPPIGSHTVIMLKEGSGDSDEMMLDEAASTSYSRGAVSKSKEIRVSAASSAEPSGPPAPEGGVVESSSSRRIRPGKDIEANAGLLTAGEWNDLHNWEDWKDLLSDQNYNEMQAHWQMFPQTRYSIFLRNNYELPIQDALVELIDDKGEVIWTARTDNAGHAELWANMTQREKSLTRFNAKVTTASKSETFHDLKPIDAGVNHLNLTVDCNTNPNVDIFFAVDATGSMGDEIAYLQAELQDVIQRSLVANKTLDVRLGSVFYRDTTDNYLTQSTPLSSDPQKTIDFIATQHATGGGDYPEAVDAALDIALTQDWSDRAVARIIFLMLDAPPHHNPSVLANLNNQVKEAAELGIKIIPITASGINRQTEFLMKFMAIATNGTYVFITDHSGIGNPHLDPVVDTYEVEKLNDLMVRLLYNYTKSNGCQDNQQVEETVKIYPNPAKDFVNISSDANLRSIRILSNTGKVMGIKSDINPVENRLDISGLVDGIYTIHCIGEEKEYAQPLVVINR